MHLLKKLLLVITLVVIFNAKADDVYVVTPDVPSCRPGELTESEIQKVLDRVNFIRSLHKLSPVTYEYSGNQSSMEACLNIVASGEGGHIDDPSSECYTPGAGEARLKSNLFQGWGSQPIKYTSVSSIDGWMIDNHSGNPDKVGHRKAIINPFLKKFAFGRAEGKTKDGSSYMSAANFLYQDYVTGGIDDDIDFIAYPYENYPPELVDKSFYLSFSAIYNKSNAFANTNVDFSSVNITVTDENGANKAVSGITWDLEGWGSVPNNVSFKVAGLQNEIKYDVKISNAKVNGQTVEYTYWFRLTNNITVEPPVAPLLSNPTDNDTEIKVNTSFAWEKSQYASQYHLQVATDNGFNDLVIDKDNIAALSFVSTTNLDYETQYFWRVQSANQNGESDWSETWTFTTGKPAPDVVSVAYPADGEKNVAITPELKWFKVSNAESYRLEIWEDPDMIGWPTLSKSGISDTTYKIENDDKLYNNTVYYWRVKAVNNSGQSEWTALLSFTTMDKMPAPGEVTVVYPFENAEKVSTTPSFEWNSVDNAEYYMLELWDNFDMIGWAVLQESNINDTTYKVTSDKELDAETEYFWRVKAANSSGQSDWSSLISFTTDEGQSVLGNNDEISLSITPNPFTESCFVTFNTQATQFINFEVFDITGNRVYSREIGYINAGENTILYKPSTSTGMYLFRVTVGNKVYQDKVLFSK